MTVNADSAKLSRTSNILIVIISLRCSILSDFRTNTVQVSHVRPYLALQGPFQRTQPQGLRNRIKQILVSSETWSH